jgi:CBS domain-containing protein
VTSTGKTAEADTAHIDAGQTLRQAGHLMRELGVRALEVRGEDGRIQGTISRDMVVRRIAAGGDPKTVTVGELAAVPPYIPARPGDSGAWHDDQGPDPGDDRIHWEGAGPDRGWHWAVPAAPDGATAGGARRKLPGLVALPVPAAGMVVPGPLAPAV